MKSLIQIDFDTDRQEQVRISGNEEQHPDAWRDLAVCMEACGCLAAIAKFELNITEHNGKPVEQYLHEYFDRVFNDYSRSYSTKYSATKN